MSGKIKTKANQKNTELKNASCTEYERNLEIEVGSVHEQKEDQDDVGDGRVEVARYFAR